MSTQKRVWHLTLVCLGFLLAALGGWADAAPTEYGFGGLGAAVGGFKPQGNRFLVSETFIQDSSPRETMMYLPVSGPVSGMVIKADNSNLERFDLEDMRFYGYAADTIANMTITGTLAAGGTTSATVTNKTLVLNASSSLVTDWGANLSAFVGVTQLSFDITMASGSRVDDIDFQSITIDNEFIDQPGVTPTTQASNLGGVVIGPTETTLSWTNGNGSNRILFALAGTAGAPTVTDGTSYTPNANFSSATDIGGGWRCLYRGSGNMATVSGFAASSTYRFVVFEMDGAGPGSKYLTTVGTNAGNVTTIGSSFLTWSSGTTRTLNAENFWAWPSGDLDGSNNTYVLHRYAGDGTTEVQKWNGSAWSTLTSFTPAAAGCVSFSDRTATDVTGVDTLHMVTGAAFGAGVAGARGIQYGLYSGGSWGFSTAVSMSDPNGWKNTGAHALAVDAGGTPHLLYLWDDANTHTEYFVLRSRSGGTWSDTRTLSTIVSSNSYNEVKDDFLLLIDSSNHFHILYLRETSEGVRDLRYATNSPSGTWSDTVLVSGNGENLSSLTGGLDSNGKVHMALAFGALGSDGTRYMTNASGSWVATNLAPGGSGYWPAGLRLKSNNDMAISLVGPSNTKVLLKQGTSPWYVGVTLAGPTTPEGYYVVTFTSDNKVMTAYANYLDTRPRELQYRLASLTPSFTVSFQTDGTAGATLSGTTNQAVAPGGDTTAVTANVPTGYSFVNWTGTGGFTSTANPVTVTNVTQAMTITAHYAINQYAVTFQTDGTAGAGLTGATSQMVNHGASSSAVTASAPTGFHLVNWTGTGGFTSSANPVTVTNVTQAMTITAHFAINQYAVTFQTDGTSGASLTGSTNQTVTHGGDSSAVTAIEPTGYSFVNWTGTGGFTSTANPVTVTNVTQAMTITAHYAINQYPVTFQTDGTAGADLTGATSQMVNHGASSSAVTANAPTGFHLVNWTGTGGFTSTANPVTVTNVTQTMTITAHFAINQYAVTFQTDGTSGASLTGSTNQTVTHGGDSSAVTAIEPTGYHFVNWTGTGGFTSTANPVTVTNVTQAMTITAHYAINQYAVTFQTDGTAGAGLTGATSQMVNHGASSSAVTANAPTGFHLVNWTGTGGFTSSANPVTVTNVTQAMTITAHFAINQYAVTFQTDGTSGASLTGSTNQTVTHGGDSSAVTAIEPTGYHFVNWTGTGGFTSAANPVTVTNVTQVMTITAHYAINQYAVTFQTDDTSGAGLTGATSQMVNHGASSSAVTANAPTGFHLANWTGTGGFTSTANPVTVTNVTQAMTITAHFAINEYAVTFLTDGTAGASLTGSTNQTVTHGGDSSAVTAIEPTGYHFVNWTGTGGFTSTANPVTVTNVTQVMTITANYAITPTVVISTRTKTVAGSLYAGGSATYTITLANTGNVDQTDNAGPELVDILPAGLELVSASAPTGTASVDVPSRTVSWDGSIPTGGSVVITVSATVRTTAVLGDTVSNQGSISYDANGDGSNESSILTDDPGVVGSDDPTNFVVAPRPLGFYVIAPCRLLDTRGAAGPSGGPALVGGETRVFPVQGHCGVPVGARAVALNVTAVQPTGSGYLALFLNGVVRPSTSSVNFAGGTAARAGNSIVALAHNTVFPESDLAVYANVANTGSVHVVLDITGYFQ